MLRLWHGLFLVWTTFLLVVPNLHLAIPALLSFVGVLVMRRATEQAPIRDAALRASWQSLILGFAGFALIGLVLNLYHGDTDPGAYERLLPFVLLPAMGWTIRAGKWSPEPWLAAAAIAAILAGIFASYEIFILNDMRAEGATGNAIKFGNGAVVLAVVCLFAAQLYPFQTNATVWRSCLAVAACAAVFASLLSGAKGGWLALILIILVAAVTYGRKTSPLKRNLILGSTLATIVATGFLAPASVVSDRIANGIDGAVHWFQSGGEVTERSVSLRFKLWEIGIRVFQENPIAGAGAEGKLIRWAELVAADPAASIIGTNTSAHNDVIEILSEGGLIAVGGSILASAGIWFAFWRWRRHTDPAILALARIGLMLVPLYLIFGLTVSVSGINFFRSVFIGFAVTLLSLMTVRLSKSAATPQMAARSDQPTADATSKNGI